MNTQQGLLAAIRDNPDDDLPRQALGDWLLEHPDPTEQARGEFIHLQCQHERLSAGDPQGEAVARRAGALLAEHRDAWLGKLPGWALASCHRGLVRVEVSGDALAGLQELERLPLWRWVVTLTMHHVTPGAVRALADWAGLRQLAELNLEGGELAQGARALALSRHLAGLRGLRLKNLLISDEGARHLAGSPSLGNLTWLDLSDNLIQDEEAAFLAHWPRPGLLRRLALTNNYIRAEGARALAGSPALEALHTLELGRNLIGPAGAMALATSTGLPALQSLDLRLNGIMDEGARAFLDSPLLGRLRHLNLVGNGILDGGLPDRLRQRLGDGLVLGGRS